MKYLNTISGFNTTVNANLYTQNNGQNSQVQRRKPLTENNQSQDTVQFSQEALDALSMSQENSTSTSSDAITNASNSTSTSSANSIAKNKGARPLDQLVASGTITEAQKDAIISAMKSDKNGANGTSNQDQTNTNNNNNIAMSAIKAYQSVMSFYQSQSQYNMA